MGWLLDKTYVYIDYLQSFHYVHAALHISTPAAPAAGWQKVASMLENRVARGKDNVHNKEESTFDPPPPTYPLQAIRKCVCIEKRLPAHPTVKVGCTQW